MSLSKAEVHHVAQLARLQFSEEESEEMASQLGDILDYVSTLDKVDTAGVPPMTRSSDLGTTLRRDESQQRISREEALRNVPAHEEEGHVLAPGALE